MISLDEYQRLRKLEAEHIKLKNGLWDELNKLRQEAQDIRSSGVCQRNGDLIPAAAKQLGKVEGIERTCNQFEKILEGRNDGKPTRNPRR